MRGTSKGSVKLLNCSVKKNVERIKYQRKKGYLLALAHI